jgi:hypothetical protein
LDIALDTDSGKIYWEDFRTFKIQRANLDGTSVEDLVARKWRTQRPALAVDTVEGKLYWTDGNPPRIRRANLDGSFVQTPVRFERFTEILNVPPNIALDTGSRKIYWAAPDAQKIQRANFDGTNIENLVTGLNTRHIALDVVRGKLYWSGFREIRCANLDGTNIEDVVTGWMHPAGIAVDIAEGKIYWANRDLHKIQRANVDGTAIEDIITELAHPPKNIALDLLRSSGAIPPNQPTKSTPWDGNSDGVVDVFDLVLVGSQFGQSGDNLSGDVNSDGVVNVFDLVLVGSHFGESTAASPSIR